jgi:hypothetical protein
MEEVHHLGQVAQVVVAQVLLVLMELAQKDLVLVAMAALAQHLLIQVHQ